MITVTPDATAHGASNAGLTTRLGALAGIAFVALAVVQNILRAAFLPDMNASTSTVIQHYDSHRGALTVTIWLVVIAAPFLALFAATLWRSVTDIPQRPPWLQVGLVGVIGTFSIFPVMVACDAALLAATNTAQPNDTVVQTLWTLHNAVFAINSIALAVALLGLSLGTIAVRLTPRAFAVIGPIGFVLLALGAAASPQLSAGSASGLYAAMGIGYLAWLAYVTFTAIGLRSPGTASQ